MFLVLGVLGNNLVHLTVEEFIGFDYVKFVIPSVGYGHW
jgi:hypothetical protein